MLWWKLTSACVAPFSIPPFPKPLIRNTFISVWIDEFSNIRATSLLFEKTNNLKTSAVLETFHKIHNRVERQDWLSRKPNFRSGSQISSLEAKFQVWKPNFRSGCVSELRWGKCIRLEHCQLYRLAVGFRIYMKEEIQSLSLRQRRILQQWRRSIFMVNMNQQKSPT